MGWGGVGVQELRVSLEQRTVRSERGCAHGAYRPDKDFAFTEWDGKPLKDSEHKSAKRIDLCSLLTLAFHYSKWSAPLAKLSMFLGRCCMRSIAMREEGRQEGKKEGQPVKTS